MLVDTRWLLEGVARTSSDRWHGILSVNSIKQHAFMERVLFCHSLAIKRGCKGSVARLSLAEWSQECDRVCLAVDILTDMSSEYKADGKEGCPSHVCKSACFMFC